MTIKKISIIADNEAYLPSKGTPGSCGYDLTATDETLDRDNRCLIYSTGVRIQLPRGYGALLMPRSSIYKVGPWVLSNGVGLIDQDYQGEIKAIFKCTSDEWDISDGPYKLGDKIGQLLIVPYIDIEWDAVTEFTAKTKRGIGSHGSTGR
jgi:dUTP pyrophosphatase